ncbi:MAG: site-2 protease family protein [Myxococcota bacterium]
MHIASPFQIPLRLHWSFLGLYAGIVGYGAWLHGLTGALAFGAFALGAFASVVLHELGHALAARRYGIGTNHITLYPWGGVAAIEGMPEDPDQEIVIALAGPAVNFALAGIGGWAWLLFGQQVLMAFVGANLVMGVFNLIPAFPMDGGRVLRSVLAKWMGWDEASRVSLKIGRVFAWLFLALSLPLKSPSLLLVGGFLHVALNAERAQLVARYWERTTGNPAWWRDGEGASGSTCLVPRV